MPRGTDEWMISHFSDKKKYDKISTMSEKVLLLDTNSIIHRAFHALPPLTDKKGEQSGAIYGTLLAFFSIMEEIKPRYVVAVFDSPGETFRHKEYKDYKAHRPKAPEELVSQIKKMPDIFRKMGVFVFAKEGLEADDIIGIISTESSREMETIIASGDRDVLQLVNENTKVYNLKRGVKECALYDKEEVEKRFEGLSPEKIVDVKALQGDASDNIPGVEGIGEKTAVKIIKEKGSIEELYRSLEKNENGSLSEKQKEKLKEEREKAFLSKKLATIKREDSLNIDLTETAFEEDTEKIKKVLEELGFSSLVKRIKGNKKEEKENLTLNI